MIVSCGGLPFLMNNSIISVYHLDFSSSFSTLREYFNIRLTHLRVLCISLPPFFHKLWSLRCEQHFPLPDSSYWAFGTLQQIALQHIALQQIAWQLVSHRFDRCCYAAGVCPHGRIGSQEGKTIGDSLQLPNVASQATVGFLLVVSLWWVISLGYGRGSSPQAPTRAEAVATFFFFISWNKKVLGDTKSAVILHASYCLPLPASYWLILQFNTCLCLLLPS